VDMQRGRDADEWREEESQTRRGKNGSVLHHPQHHHYEYWKENQLTVWPGSKKDLTDSNERRRGEIFGAQKKNLLSSYRTGKKSARQPRTEGGKKAALLFVIPSEVLIRRKKGRRRPPGEECRSLEGKHLRIPVKGERYGEGGGEKVTDEQPISFVVSWSSWKKRIKKGAEEKKDRHISHVQAGVGEKKKGRGKGAGEEKLLAMAYFHHWPQGERDQGSPVIKKKPSL